MQHTVGAPYMLVFFPWMLRAGGLEECSPLPGHGELEKRARGEGLGGASPLLDAAELALTMQLLQLKTHLRPSGS